jgi:matrix metalloproteinase-14 (membrane-inserted)
MVARIPLLVLLLVTGSALLAYSVKPHAWPTMTVAYRVNPQTPDAAPAAVLAAVQAGANAWHDQAGIAFRWSYAGTTTQTAVVLDHQNIVIFRPESNGSTLATTYWWTDAQGNFVDADVKFWDAGHLLVAGDTGCTNGFYIRDIAAHEFGHALGMNHSSISTATMYPTMSTCSSSWRSLDSDDIAGVRTLYPLQTAPPLAPSGVTVAR